MVYNSKPLRTQDQIDDVLFYLRRTRYPDLFVAGQGVSEIPVNFNW